MDQYTMISNKRQASSSRREDAQSFVCYLDEQKLEDKCEEWDQEGGNEVP
jgi:hypothetical protein